LQSAAHVVGGACDGKDNSAMAHLERALEIATAAHDGQKDKTGCPYLAHLQTVAEAVDTLDEKIVAYLHDVIEKAPGWTRSRLEAEGFSPAIVSAVDALTRRDGEDDDTFVRRAASNRLARAVKLADLKDNLRQAQAAGLPSQKYRRGLDIFAEEFGEAGQVRS
jgi:(p)ppGpp synthase/HD superfamily hydrolase